MDTLGFIELSSIALGIQVADEMSKAAEVKLIFAKSSCPGKYHAMISGSVSSVTSSINRGIEAGKGYVVAHFVLPRVHEQVVKAIHMSPDFDNISAIGVLEFFDVAESIRAADAAVKAADVSIVDLRLGISIGGKSYVVLTGDVGAIRAAVDAASVLTEENGMLVNKVVIPRPSKMVIQSLY